MRLRPLTALAIISAVVSACSPTPESAPADAPPGDLVASATRVFEAYGDAVRGGRPETLARFYAPSGVVRVLDGQRQRMTRAGIDSMYRDGWQAPAFFTWEDLQFDSVDAQQVLVTGFFRWQARTTPDTNRYAYAALLQAADSGLFIRFEHETAVGRP